MKPAPATTSSRRALRSCSGRWLISRPVRYSTSNAMRTGGVATTDSSGSRSHSNRDRSWSSNTANSPSSTSVLQPRDSSRDVRVAAGVVDAVTAHQADAGAVLVGQHAVAADLLLVDPAGAVKGRADERWGHR